MYRVTTREILKITAQVNAYKAYEMKAKGIKPKDMVEELDYGSGIAITNLMRRYKDQESLKKDITNFYIKYKDNEKVQDIIKNIKNL